MELTVRDMSGRPVFHVDTSESVARDDNGKPVAVAADTDTRLRDSATFAARIMRNGDPRLLQDLGVPDVLQPSTRAEWGIPKQSVLAGERIADIVSPVTFVSKEQGYWFQENVLDTIDPVNANVAADGNTPSVNPLYAATSFKCGGYGLAAQISWDVANNADFDVRKRAVRRLCEGLRLSREMRVATLLTTASNWATGNKFSTAIKWSGGTNPVPLTDLFTALKDSLLPADTLILSENVAPYFHQVTGTGPQVRDFVQAGGQLPRLLYAKAKYSVSAVAGGATPQYVWATGTTGWNVPLVRCGADWQNQDTDLLTCRTLRWLGERDCKDGAVVDGVLVRQFVDNRTRSHWIVVAHSDIEIMQSNQVGSLIQSVS